MCCDLSVCLSVGVAPGSAPVNVEARPLSSSTVVVEWNEPLVPNGLIQVATLISDTLLVRRTVCSTVCTGGRSRCTSY